jgi:hypothetical protein
MGSLGFAVAIPERDPEKQKAPTGGGGAWCVSVRWSQRKLAPLGPTVKPYESTIGRRDWYALNMRYP